VKTEIMKETYQGLLGLDRLPTVVKTLNWTICVIIAACFAVFDYFNAQVAFPPNSPMRASFGWLALALISPICIAIAWLRLTGVKWRHAFLLFIFVPVVYKGILFILELLLSLFRMD
jgi:hypothetical protein